MTVPHRVEFDLGPKLRVLCGYQLLLNSSAIVESKEKMLISSAWGFLTTKHSRRFSNDVALALREKILAGMDFRVANHL